MSLRARLTLLYSSLIGGILLLFGVLIYILIGAFLLDQVDRTLNQTVRDILANSQVSAVGELNVITLPSLELTASVYVQYWDRENHLQMTSPAFGTSTSRSTPPTLFPAAPFFAMFTSKKSTCGC